MLVIARFHSLLIKYIAKSALIIKLKSLTPNISPMKIVTQKEVHTAHAPSGFFHFSPVLNHAPNLSKIIPLSKDRT